MSVDTFVTFQRGSKFFSDKAFDPYSIFSFAYGNAFSPKNDETVCFSSSSVIPQHVWLHLARTYVAKVGESLLE
ncbi:MAG: hypothetical protein VX743_01445 [Actinomycetota bacterium]|nr:hypothetical protein [Actinomycetota bacterium]